MKRLFSAVALVGLGAKHLSECNGVAAAVYKATNYFSDVTCSTDVNQFLLSPRSMCPANNTCRMESWNSFPRSTVLCASSVVSHAQTVFGKDPYLLVPHYLDTTCTTENYIHGQRLTSSLCTVSGPSSSIRYSVRIDWTLDTLTYSAIDCSGKPLMVNRTSSANINSDKCLNGVKFQLLQAPRWSPAAYTAYTYFNDSTCSTAYRILFNPVRVESIVDDSDYTKCGKDSSGLYFSRDPFIIDVMAYTGGVLGYDVPYIVQEAFYDTNCSTDQNVTSYRADNKCINMGGYSELHLIKAGVYTIYQYAGETCSGVGSNVLTVPSKFWNNGSCISNRKFNSTVTDMTAIQYLPTTTTTPILSYTNPPITIASTPGGLSPKFAQSNGVPAAVYKATNYYSDSSCNSQVDQFYLTPQSSCSPNDTCRIETWNDYQRSTVTCISSVDEHARKVFGTDPHILEQRFVDSTCTREYTVFGQRLKVDLKSRNACRRINATSSVQYIVEVGTSNAKIKTFQNSSNCSSTAPIVPLTLLLPMSFRTNVLMESRCTLCKIRARQKAASTELKHITAMLLAPLLNE